MHAAHDRNGRAALVDHGGKEPDVVGQVPHVGGRIVDKTVPPGQMDQHIRFAQAFVQVVGGAENLLVGKLGALIHPFEGIIARNDAVSAVQTGAGHVAADIPGGTGHQNSLLH